MKPLKLFLSFIAFGLLLTGCSSKEASPQKIIYVKKSKDSTKEKEIDSLYEKERKATLSKIIQEPIKPMKTPDIILRVLTMPYTDENGILHTQNYQYIKVEEGRWIIGEYLNHSSKGSQNLLTPLSVK